MQLNWLIEPYDKSCDDLIREVKRQGHAVDLVEYYSLAHAQETKDPNGLPYSKANYEEKACVLFQGTIQLGVWLLNNKPWVPNLWLTAQNYLCSHYFPLLQEFLFNEKFVFLPQGCFRASARMLLDTFGVDGCLFCRPDSGLKTFGGQVLDLGNEERFEREWSWIENFSKPEDFILISNPKTIQEEYRFICAEGEIVSGSKYKSRHVLDVSTSITDAAKAKCQEILETGFAPDPMFTLDICKGMDDKYYLLEVNSFSTAGLYDCDLEKVVKKASELALKQNHEYWGI